MRQTFKLVLDKLHGFLNGNDDHPQIKDNSLTAMIEQAIQKKTAVHVILAETSFTGDIVKHDANRQQIIVKNFSKNVTRIIRISDIVLCIPLFFLTDLFKMKMNGDMVAITTSLQIALQAIRDIVFCNSNVASSK